MRALCLIFAALLLFGVSAEECHGDDCELDFFNFVLDEEPYIPYKASTPPQSKSLEEPPQVTPSKSLEEPPPTTPSPDPTTEATVFSTKSDENKDLDPPIVSPYEAIGSIFGVPVVVTKQVIMADKETSSRALFPGFMGLVFGVPPVLVEDDFEDFIGIDEKIWHRESEQWEKHLKRSYNQEMLHMIHKTKEDYNTATATSPIWRMIIVFAAILIMNYF